MDGESIPGYVNKITEDGKKYITFSEPEAWHMKWAFETISKGLLATEHVFNQAKEKGLKCNRNSFLQAIKNPCYCGKVIVPQFKDEDMYLAEGKHKPLISERLFYEVQDVLKGKNRNKGIKIVSHNLLPLRGFLLCPECQKVLTGSPSKGRYAYYYYYHCQKQCKVRFKAGK
ncbi:recombinase family protein [Pedobacter hartonius]|uniref:Recombinase n=1 Tax=Pedobacter hartonius TaxID=425514 RepID=A0A1H4CDF2_9SPHI|nr:recombinase family protein [Pedobacter hartonius]SEA58350.1 Recombinase [Pedobacter hartonius]